jgi:hypothetical protein
MAISPEDRARAEELAKELFKITGSRFRADGTSKTFAEIEDEASLLGDLITSMAINQAVAEAPGLERLVRCPQCHAEPGEHDPKCDEPIVIQTTRGEVEWVAEGYYCRRCRRSFFPSAR